jgi:hypothetical protein
MINRYASSVALVALCATPSAFAAAPPEAPATTAPSRDVAYYDAYADGDALHVLVGYGRKGNPAVQLWHWRSDDGGKTWRDAVRVNANDEPVAGPHPGENPQIAARGDRVVVIWTGAAPAGGRGGGAISSAVSDDGGVHWRPGVNPAGDDDTSYHALIDLAAGDSGFHAAWLQAGPRSPDATTRPLPALRHVASQDGAKWQTQRIVADATCYCCWNTIHVGDDDELGVLFRGGEPRDMRYARQVDGAWQESVAVGAFGWEFAGCPHVGGALADARGALHALVWTGLAGKEGLYHIASSDHGATWGEPQRVGGDHARHADLAATKNGELVAIWDEPGAGGEGSVVQRVRSGDGGKTWSDAQRASGTGDIAMHPRVIAVRGSAVGLWLARDAEGRTTLRVDGRALPAP